jgi:hypothetical protein
MKVVGLRKLGLSPMIVGDLARTKMRINLGNSSHDRHCLCAYHEHIGFKGDQGAVPMKTTHANSWIRLSLLGLVLALILAFLTIPLATVGISHINGGPLPPENLDIRPIPVPEPPLPLVRREPSPATTPSPPSTLAAAVIAIPVPTPPEMVQEQPVPAAVSMSASYVLDVGSSRTWPVVIVIALILLLLFFWVGYQRVSTVHSARKECVSC